MLTSGAKSSFFTTATCALKTVRRRVRAARAALSVNPGGLQQVHDAEQHVRHPVDVDSILRRLDRPMGMPMGGTTTRCM